MAYYENKEMRNFQRRYVPYVLAISVQIFYSFLFFILEIAYNHGLNPYVCVSYQYLIGGLVMFPFAYFLERKARPKMTFALFIEIFALAFLGVSLNINMYFASLKYTSSTFISSMVNTIPAITFVVAIVLRLEVVNIRKPGGIAKIMGTIVSVAGALIISLYNGPVFHGSHSAPIHIRSDHTQKNWVKGSILITGSCICWSLWFTLQTYTVKKYPAQLSLTVLMNILGGAQSAIFTAFIQRQPAAWRLNFFIEYVAVLYAGVLCSGLTIFFQLWYTKQKGPVFAVMFNPLSTVITAILAYSMFGEELKLSCLLGGGVAIVGLYMVLWGKGADEDPNKPQQNLSSLVSDDEKKDDQIKV